MVQMTSDIQQLRLQFNQLQMAGASPQQLAPLLAQISALQRQGQGYEYGTTVQAAYGTYGNEKPDADPQFMQAGIGYGALVSLLPALWKLGKGALPWIAGGAAGSALGGLFDGGGGGPSQPVVPGTDVVLQGPGHPEPYPGMIAKEWAGIGGSRFYLLINGRVIVRKRNGVYRLIKRPAMLHMKTSNPRLGDIVKADRIIQRAVKVVKKRLPSARRRS